VAVASEHAAEVMSAAAGFHSDNASRQLLGHPDQRLAPHPAAHDDIAGPIKADDAAEVLAKVHAENRDCRHGFPPPDAPASLRRRKEGRAIP
jgi:hypothetical protein